MDDKYKIIAANYAREGKTKLELVMNVPKATSEELKEINNFYNASKEILILKRKGVSDEKLITVLSKVGYTKNDFNIIKGKKELKSSLIDVGSNLVSLIFVLVFVFVVGSLLINVLGSTDWDFLKKDYVVSGLIFGDDTNFSDLKISANTGLKNVLINENEYSAIIRCSKELTLSFAKKGFVPVHKNISCEEQELDIVFATMNEFVKLNLSSVTNVEDKGVKLDLTGSDLVILGTNTPAVNPSVSVTAFNPNTPGDMQFFPGELEGLREDGNVTGLVSYGFAKIIAEDENGNSLDFKEGKSATVTFPLDSKQRVDAPSEMPLWYFDEIKGTWVEEGLAKKTCVGNICQYVGEITKVRSWWNADHPVPKLSLKFKSFKIWPRRIFSDSLSAINKQLFFDSLTNSFNGYLGSGGNPGGNPGNDPGNDPGNNPELQKLMDILEAAGLDYSPQILSNLKNLTSEEFAYGLLITQAAKLYEGSLGWAHAAVYNYPFSGYKCNLFPYDIYASIGVNLPLFSDPAIDFFEGSVSYHLPAYTVSTFRNAEELPGLRRLAPTEIPMPGDIVVDHEHAALIGEHGIGYGVMGSSFEYVTENINGWGAYQSTNSPYVYWRIDPTEVNNIPEFVTINSGPPVIAVPSGLLTGFNFEKKTKVLDVDWNYGDFIFTEFDKYDLVVKSPQGFNFFRIPFEDLNSEKNVEVISPVSLVFLSINDIPSDSINFNSNRDGSTEVKGFSLENCVLWGDNVTKISSCIINYDSLIGLSREKAFVFANDLSINGKDKAKILVNLAKNYNYINSCYFALPLDYYSGLACMKLVDKDKQIDSNQNISNILNKNLPDYELSFVLRNLSEYYMDRNYCLPIPAQSQRLACLAKFPEPVVIPVVVPLCGNGVIDGKEKCDGSNFVGKSCASYGFNSGSLSCVNCQIIKSGCSNISDPNDSDEPDQPASVCGNGVIEGNEDCDSTNFDGATCVDYGFASGNLICNNCRVVTSSCVSAPVVPTQVCNNTVIEGTEQCEGTNFNGKTCATYGFNTGNLSCNNCQIINSGCSNTVAPPVEIDPLEIFDCNYNSNYSSPIKDNANNSFWIKEIQDGKLFGLRIPFKKIDCNGETVLTEDDSGNIIPCITQLNDVDGCILEKRELLTISSASDNYVAGGKYNNVYKQNPVDFVGSDGNIYFLIKSGGKHEFVKFSPTNPAINQTLQVYSDADYLLRTVPSVLRSVPSGSMFWIVLNGALHDVYVGDTGSTYDVGSKCYNAPYVKGSTSHESGMAYVWRYGFGKVFNGFDYVGNSLGKVYNKIFCDDTYDSTPFESGTRSYGEMKGMNFYTVSMTYKGDGFGNLLVRSTKDINEFSIDSNDISFPSATR